MSPDPGGHGDGGEPEDALGGTNVPGWWDDEMAGLRGLTSKQASMLTNENRCKIVEQLQREPALNITELADKTGMSRTVASFHLDRLENVDLVVRKESQRGEEKMCFLKQDANLGDEDPTRTLLASETAREVALFVLENRGVSTEEIAEGIGCSQRTARRYLRKLENLGLVDRQRIGREREAHPLEPLVEWKKEVWAGLERRGCDGDEDREGEGDREGHTDDEG